MGLITYEKIAIVDSSRGGLEIETYRNRIELVRDNIDLTA